jgi:hypothetical protein
MKAQDVTATLDLALAASGLDQMNVVHRPRLLSDNGSSYVASDLADWLDKQNIEHVRGAPIIRRPRAKSSAGIKRSRTASCLSTTTYPAISNARSPPSWRTTTMPAITRASQSTPADVYFGRAEAILLERERIKRQTIANRRLQHQLHAA